MYTDCKHADIFGKPGTGAHKRRLGPFAAVDLLGTVGLAFLAAAVYKRRRASFANIFTAFIVVFVILMIITIAIHRIFCVNTALNRMIFGEIKLNSAPYTTYIR